MAIVTQACLMTLIWVNHHNMHKIPKDPQYDQLGSQYFIEGNLNCIGVRGKWVALSLVNDLYEILPYKNHLFPETKIFF